MSTTSHSPTRIAQTAHALAVPILPDYCHKCAPKRFTQPQLFTILVLKTNFNCSYRDIAQWLSEWSDLRQAIDLKTVPSHSTLHQAHQRLLKLPTVRKLLDQSIQLIQKKHKGIKLAAIDSTGLESSHISPYFVRRKQRGQRKVLNPKYQTMTYRRFPKLGIMIDCSSHLILSHRNGKGPRPDVDELDALIHTCPSGIGIQTLEADVGYDSESNHVLLRDYHGIQSIIPARHGRRSNKPPAGKYRRQMRQSFKRKLNRQYGQRWQVETVMSMLKRNLGISLAARSDHARNREMSLRVLTHNVMI